MVRGTGTPAALSSDVVTTLSEQLTTTSCALTVTTPRSSSRRRAASAWDSCRERSRTAPQAGTARWVSTTRPRTSTSSTSRWRRANASRSIFSSTRTRDASMARRGSLTPVLLLGRREHEQGRSQRTHLEVGAAVRAGHHLADDGVVVAWDGGLAFRALGADHTGAQCPE